MTDIQTHTHHGHYSMTGPVELPVETDSKIVKFIHYGFKFSHGRYSVLYLGDLQNSEKILVRISSNCQWAFYFGSQLCDCRWQIEEAKRQIVQEGKGLIIFAHDQNGKSISLEDHWLIYAEGQRKGHELVVDAYEQLGFREDYRQYDDIWDILRHYKVQSIRLMTNSPRREKYFRECGIKVSIEHLEQPMNEHLQQEYRSKKHKLGHYLRTPDID